MAEVRKFAICFACIVCGNGYADKISVHADFEGGSARVIEIDQEAGVVRIMPAGDPVRGWPAWWYVRISGLQSGQTLTLNVVPSSLPIPAGHPGTGRPLAGSWALPNQATWSSDRKQWQQTKPGVRGDAGITYELVAESDELWVAWGPPATPSTVNDWNAAFSDSHDYVEPFELADTIERRKVRGLRIAGGDAEVDSRPVVWLHARQHAWESGSSWVARGIIDWLVGDNPDAIWLREHALVFVVPIMDVDRTATGDGGKESSPHDHNRDWSRLPHYPEVRSVQKRVRQWSDQNRMAVFVDLHNPGPGDRRAFFYVAPDEAIEAERKPRRDLFLDTIVGTWQAPIKLDRRTRSTGPNYHRLWRQISSTWVTLNANEHTVAVCLETPWNTPDSNTAGYAKVGASLGRGISQFLRSTQTENSN